MSARHVMSLSHGASLLAADRTLFQFWAPDRARVDLDIDGQATRPMRRERDGWYRIEHGCGAGTRYRYRLGPDLAVPDPASRHQMDDVHGFSEVVNPAAYRWRNASWPGRPWEEVVIYEAHAGIMGGFKGLQAKLADLVELGITAIELMPIADFPGPRNWGYDGVLPFAPDTSYGSIDDLKSLIDAAHGRGLMVFLDVVYNHFGPDGNYLGQYASSFFRADEHTPWGAAIDFRNPIVRQFFLENALYWLEEYQIDGLRLDAVHAISSQDWLPELAAAVRARFSGRHIHLMLEHDGNIAELLEHDFNAQWNDDAHHALHVLLAGETAGYYADYAAHPTEMLARCLAEGFAFQGEASPYRGNRSRGTPSGHLSSDRFIVFLQNHDQVGNRAFGDRLTTLTDPDRLRAATALLLLAPHIPLLFMGEEFGSEVPFLYFTSYTGELADAVKEGRRREFARFAEFSADTMRRKIPDPNAPESYAASIPAATVATSKTGQAWFGFYRDLLAIRKQWIMPRLAGARSVRAGVLAPAAIEASWRLGDDSLYTLAVNLGTETIHYRVPAGDVLYRLNCNIAASPSLPAGSLSAILLRPQ